MSSDLPARLRLGTRDLHARAERSGVMPDFLAGRIGVPTYCALLRNLHALYGALEAGLHALPAGHALAQLDAPVLRRTPALAADLATLLGADWAAVPLQPATAAYAARLDDLARDDPQRLAAHAYVRYLGDLHGGQVLRRLVGKLLDRDDGAGTSFYDYGSPEQVLALRERVRAVLAELPGTEAETAGLVDEARWSFEQHIRLFDELRAA